MRSSTEIKEDRKLQGRPSRVKEEQVAAEKEARDLIGSKDERALRELAQMEIPKAQEDGFKDEIEKKEFNIKRKVLVERKARAEACLRSMQVSKTDLAKSEILKGYYAYEEKLEGAEREVTDQDMGDILGSPVKTADSHLSSPSSSPDKVNTEFKDS